MPQSALKSAHVPLVRGAFAAVGQLRSLVYGPELGVFEGGLGQSAGAAPRVKALQMGFRWGLC